MNTYQSMSDPTLHTLSRNQLDRVRPDEDTCRRCGMIAPVWLLAELDGVCVDCEGQS